MLDELTPQSIYEQYPTATWEVEGKTFTFAVERIEESFGNRLAQHKRLYRDGARLDDTYAEARQWTLTCLFFNHEWQEGGIDGLEQYPDNVNALCDSFEVHETGTLTVPTRGPRRCRAETYRRVEGTDARDAASVIFTWLEDNEDDAESAQWLGPSARSVTNQLALDVLDAAALEGAFSESLNSLSEFAKGLVDLAEAPGAYVADAEARIDQVTALTESVAGAFTKESGKAISDAETLLSDPGGSLALRKLQKLSDTVARISDEQFEQTASLVSVTYPRTLSIMDIATDQGQDVGELMELNGTIEDMMAIPPGTIVLVWGER